MVYKLKTKKSIIFLVAVLLVIISSVFLYSIKKVEKNNSRILMEVSEQVVREKRPTPIQSSRFYATIAKDYYEKVYVSKTPYTYSTSTLEGILQKIAGEDGQEIIPGARLVGAPFWDSSAKPFSPNAAKLSRFVIGSNFPYKVPKPPVYGGTEFNKALAEVRYASEERTADQAAAINFWGGVPGTEAPAGIWQNRLYDVTKKYKLNDEEYAYVQMILAESVADAFVECWKVKYTYWTKRPDMTDKSIETAMPNPPFPGYVSGHSTISFAAATVLAQFFPNDSKIFLTDAEEAKNSRLWAGIHFPHDNEEGELLGKAVGQDVIKNLNLKAVR